MRAKVNDVIQVNENFVGEAWIGCLMIVNEVKSWGIMAGLKIPNQGIAYLRIPDSHYDVIGQAALVEGGEDE